MEKALRLWWVHVGAIGAWSIWEKQLRALSKIVAAVVNSNESISRKRIWRNVREGALLCPFWSVNIKPGKEQGLCHNTASAARCVSVWSYRRPCGALKALRVDCVMRSISAGYFWYLERPPISDVGEACGEYKEVVLWTEVNCSGSLIGTGIVQ